jgi:hemolysin activation/secretion protein
MRMKSAFQIFLKRRTNPMTNLMNLNLRTVKRTTLAMVVIMMLGTTAAHAQLAAQQSVANPGRVEEQIRIRGLDRVVTPNVDVEGAPIAAAPAGSENITFTLNDITFEGVTAVDPARLRRLYADRVGQTITLAEVYAIAGQVTSAFRNDGYILTQVVVPPQTIDGGVVRLQVVEGYINTVTVGLEPDAPAESAAAMSLIEGYAGRISTGRALNAKDLERYMLLINDLPGVSARGILAPSPTAAGGADLTILIQRDPFDGLIGIDNYGTRFLGPVQLSGAAAFNSLFGNNERLSTQAVLAPDADNGIELGYVALGYEQPLLPNGLKMAFNTNYTATNPGYTLDRFDVRGYSRYYSAEVSYPFIRTRATSLTSTLTFDVRNVTTSNNFEATRKDRIRALRASTRLEHLDSLFGAGLNIVDVELSQGLGFMGATTKSDVNKSRAEGEGVFTKLNIEAQRLQRLADRWNLLFGVRGQLSNDALLSSEEFGLGGLGYARGFDPSEVIGDEGIAGKIELQWNMPGTLAFTHSNQFYGFYDAGSVWNDDPSAPNLERDTLTSAGFGVRSKIMDYTNMDIAVAFPLNRNVQTQKDHDPRVYFSLSRKF